MCSFVFGSCICMQEQGHSAHSSELSDRKLINMVLQGRIPQVIEAGSIPEQSGSPSRRRTGMGSNQPRRPQAQKLSSSLSERTTRRKQIVSCNCKCAGRAIRRWELSFSARGPTLLKNAAPSESQVRLRPRKHTARALPRKKRK